MSDVERSPLEEENDYLAILKAMNEEIEQKKMVPMDRLMRALRDHGVYCKQCEADDTLYFDPTERKIRCLWCGYSVKIETLAKRARKLPIDYLDRMIAKTAKKMRRDELEGAVWVTDGYIAEKVGEPKYSYPERESFEPLAFAESMLASFEMYDYEEAKLSRTLYRSQDGYDGPLIAMLQSEHHTVYINNDYAKHMQGIYAPYICGKLLAPVLIAKRGELCRMVMPMRFDPEKVEES